MKSIVIHKADDDDRGEPHDTIIKIASNIKPEIAVPDADRIYQQDAKTLEAALYASLPRGTYDRLVYFMLQRAASHYRRSGQDIS